MEASRELLFFFSALGAFNGLLLSVYFFFVAKPKHISNFFLGALLLTLSIRIGKSVFFYFNPDLSANFLQFGISVCAFIGPSLYFYLKSMTTPEHEMTDSWKYHVMIILPIILVVGYIYPWHSNWQIWADYFISAIYFEWFIYILASAFIIRKVVSRFMNRKDKMNSVEFWILSVFFGNFIIWLAYNTISYTSYITGALSFSFIFYLLILLLFFNKKKDSILFKKLPKYGDKKIDSSEAKTLLTRLDQLMLGKKLHKNPNLKITHVAKELKITSPRLSQLINDNLDKNFSSFLNEYRINEAKKMLQTNSNYSLEGIGYECGFNSKSTFYSTFKKLTGMTPSKFKETL